MRKLRVAFVLLVAGSMWAHAGARRSSVGISNRAFDYLADAMDRYHRVFPVYTDIAAAGNHFTALGRMPADHGAAGIDLACAHRPLAGDSCIEGRFDRTRGAWGGFYFLNGTLEGEEESPRQNWGEVPGAGLDMRGASKVTFYARGEQGGERVEFFVGGVGWRVDGRGASVAQEAPWPDSMPKVSTGTIELSKRWRRYTLEVAGHDLQYVIGGFGWVVDAGQNRGSDTVRFYMDEISWDKSRLDDLRFLRSYDMRPDIGGDFDRFVRNTAYTYDNALALLVFLARGTREDCRRATILADSFVHAVWNDRAYDSAHLRNAYMAADLVSFPGWKPRGKEGVARLPNFWDKERGQLAEDRTAIGSHSGNMAWSIIALTAAYRHLHKDEYLETAEQLGFWVLKHCLDVRGAGGFTGGCEGWYGGEERLLWKSTEHNLDLYVAFMRLYEAGGREDWLRFSTHAKTFVEAMWDADEGKFWAGTLDDGVEVNEEVIPLDVQTWAVLALPDWSSRHRPLAYARQHHAVDRGFDYNTDKDGVWLEGTAQVAVAYRALGDNAAAGALLVALDAEQMPNGAIPAASKDGVTTGFFLPEQDGEWTIYRRGHVGATCWYLFAKLNVNPYWF